ncbi:hypothetical protein AOL_s00097g373 [Orbilia oligospora ATCC 24927]|uniref:F-box domain-containing protein n=1 Tax=Arthrobotrys oligospora (strain ATCC 24927 / CBS 115.81 / DSM 1491) TaxID=756982 RepID=G1XJ46_ARTOA|nr:hypothetical protein AOL_s00097g373 [Orbilia oligospora ATCC 24927]EGX46947.1 hypothetical protein AOL_s00097g373 [Orbilia oligospora ATCC 24927]
MPDLTAEISALSIVGNGLNSETMKISSASKPSKNYFATSPVEIGEKIATSLDKGSLIAFSSCSRLCRAISVALLWSKVVLEFPIVESRKLRIECILRNAQHVRSVYLKSLFDGSRWPLTNYNSAIHMALDIRLLLSQPQVAFTGTTIPTFLGMFPGLKELRLVELTPQSWEVRCNIVAHILNHQHCLEILGLWLCGVTRCPIDIVYRIFQRHELHVVRSCRLKILEILIHQSIHIPSERGEYLFKPFLNLFGTRLGSLEDFCFNIEGGPVTNMVIRRQQIEGLGPEQASLALTPLSMPSLSFLDFDSICCFEDLSHFMTLDSFENVRCLSIYTYISTPCEDIVFLGPAPVEAKHLADTLQHFKALRFLLINMGDPIGNNGGAGILSPEFWDAWAGEVAKFCWAVSTLFSIRGQAGLTGRNFRVTRSEDEIQIEEVVKTAEQKAIWADIKTTDPNKNWDYWKSNMCIED